jgi:hypothetical protein
VTIRQARGCRLGTLATCSFDGSDAFLLQCGGREIEVLANED